MLRRLAAALALVLPALALSQTVRVYPTDTVQSSCSLGALNAYCQVPMAGKSSAGFVITAVSSPNGMTLVAETSRDGTNYDQHQFVDMDSGDRWNSIPNASLAVGLTKTIVLGGGVRYARVKASAWTSGSVTVAVTATDSAIDLSDVNLANSNKPTYVACSAAEANTASSSALAIESGSTKTTRIRAIWITNPGAQTTAGIRVMTLRRTTTAGSGGTTLTPAPVDTSAITGDAAFSGAARTKGTAGTAGTTLLTLPVWVPTTVANLANPIPIWPPFATVGGKTSFKDITIPVGTANGIEVNDAGATGGANFYICALLTEE